LEERAKIVHSKVLLGFSLFVSATKEISKQKVRQKLIGKSCQSCQGRTKLMSSLIRHSVGTTFMHSLDGENEERSSLVVVETSQQWNADFVDLSISYF
jgi:hypothetical protein